MKDEDTKKMVASYIHGALIRTIKVLVGFLLAYITYQGFALVLLFIKDVAMAIMIYVAMLLGVAYIIMGED